MNLALKPVALALLVAASQTVGSASAQSTNAPAAPAVRRAASQANKVPSVASAPGGGAIETEASFERAIDEAPRAHIEGRWRAADVKTGYTMREEPQRHFGDAAAAYARKDYRAAATDIRNAAGYLRLEAARATGAGRKELESSVAQLDGLAYRVEKGALKDEHAMTADSAKAEHALALEHRANAIDAWTRKQYHQTGYELKAAAHSLESAAGWMGGEVKASASTTAADTRRLGDKLAFSATWTRDEVAKGFDALGNGIDAVGHEIGDARKASPFDVGA